MSETTDIPTARKNVRLTLTCGNAKCAHVITSQVVSAEAWQAVEHTMATQQIQCPQCLKVGRNHVTHEETAEATYLRHQPEVAPDVPRRHREDHQRKNSTPLERGSRRRGTRAAGKVGPPPMSQRQLEKLQRRGQADAILGAARGRTEPERNRQDSQRATPQPTVAQPIPPSAGPGPTPPALPRTRTMGRNAAAAAAAAAAAPAAPASAIPLPPPADGGFSPFAPPVIDATDPADLESPPQ